MIVYINKAIKNKGKNVIAFSLTLDILKNNDKLNPKSECNRLPEIRFPHIPPRDIERMLYKP